MFASELIAELQSLIDRHGDLEVTAATLAQEYTLAEFPYADGEIRTHRKPVEPREPRFLLELKDSIPFTDH